MYIHSVYKVVGRWTRHFSHRTILIPNIHVIILGAFLSPQAGLTAAPFGGQQQTGAYGHTHNNERTVPAHKPGYTSLLGTIQSIKTLVCVYIIN